MTDLGISDLTVEYTSGDYTVRPVEDFNLRAMSGELVVLLGPSGCGKTTLLSCLAGILTPAKGTIVVGGTDVTALRGEGLTLYRRKTVGIVFQAFNLIPSLSAMENAAAPLLISGVKRSEARARAAILLERVGLKDRMNHRPAELSGGQQQRVAIARALAHDPPLIVADEPTAHLDYIQVESVLSLLRELATHGRLIVVATHDERFVPLADRTVELAKPTIGSTRPPEHVTLEPDEILFRQGSRGDLIYVVENGEIEIYRERADGGREHLARIGVNNYFGELGPLFGIPRSASARAIVPAVLTGYTVTDFREMAATDPRFSRFFKTAAGLAPDRPVTP